ncbi:MAG: hypothetical protein P5702_15035 [Limnospira sp. PMC 1291.21]|uniref:Uncharacterized protein n=3 Tax=Limnospira TaxID=2596745 RepID=A0A9P1NXH3_9CYAN|nr:MULTISPECIES: hypothetical protein [Limnospira]EKD11113.1 hypothetical protein SPLC1_S041100 [Arthrospira platensis C1]KDR57186.1 hypothetical protein APPUASWS_012710 [Arthrospira platensis str. Paraca]MDC0839184.1 hypothetical protein [Limnoraphis robusta]MDT9312321.1 hypothetical protein [Limnospira sp. Paracas R14]MDY7054309.1 hypothetical protein [Limnospira fusiformis LS22]QJB27787.1 hypothetical protein HFV01_20885 [Limnospira fusiformis SAG 85.79]RAQ38902.1 hypothetical protein B9S
MNQERPTLQFNWSGIGNWIVVIGIMGLLASVGLGWLVNSILILIGLAVITPIILVFGARWWLNRNLIEDSCPVCSHEFIALNQTQCQCPNCGEPIQIEQGRFTRLTPPGTIDVKAVDVSSRVLED